MNKSVIKFHNLDMIDSYIFKSLGKIEGILKNQARFNKWVWVVAMLFGVSIYFIKKRINHLENEIWDLKHSAEKDANVND